jgi:hypothetical protein
MTRPSRALSNPFASDFQLFGPATAQLPTAQESYLRTLAGSSAGGGPGGEEEAQLPDLIPDSPRSTIETSPSYLPIHLGLGSTGLWGSDSGGGGRKGQDEEEEEELGLQAFRMSGPQGVARPYERQVIAGTQRERAGERGIGPPLVGQDAYLDRMKGPLRALALCASGGARSSTSNAPGSVGLTGPPAIPASSYLLPPLPSSVTSSADDMRRTVSPKEAFNDYDEVDNMLHSGSNSSAFGRGSLFGPLPSASRPTTTATSSSSTLAPTSPRTSSANLHGSSHHHHHHHHANHRRTASHPFSVPQNAVSWADSTEDDETDVEGMSRRSSFSYAAPPIGNSAGSEEEMKVEGMGLGATARYASTSTWAPPPSAPIYRRVEDPTPAFEERSRRKVFKTLIESDDDADDQLLVSRVTQDDDEEEEAEEVVENDDDADEYLPPALPPAPLPTTRRRSAPTSTKRKSLSPFTDLSSSPSPPAHAPPPNKRRRRTHTSLPTSTPSSALRCSHQMSETEICGTLFRRPYDLARHRETIHGDGVKGGRKEWGCEGCGGVFSRKDALIRHGRIRGCKVGI